MMTLIRNNMVSVISGVVLLLLLGFGAWTMTSTKVVAKMQQITGSAGQLNSLMSNAKNESVIEAARKRAEAMKLQLEQGVATVKQINGHQALMTGIFPKPESETRRFEFKAAYTAELDKLGAAAGGADLPGPAEVQEAEEEITEIRELEREKAEVVEERPDIRDTSSPGGGPATSPPTPFGGAQNPTGQRPGDRETNDPKYNPRLRAQVNRARAIRMYVGSANRRSFHVSPIVRQNTPPEVEAMWFAQVGLWLQQDIVGALARVNEKAAAALSADDEPSVLTMPVKRLERIDINGYVTPTTLIPFPRDTSDSASGGGGGLAGNTTPAGAKSLTGRASDADFDVVRFELLLVVDQRDLLQIIDEITRTNFYQCVDCDFQQVDPKEQVEGFYYGTEPCSRVRLVFEGYFARQIYDPLMPEEVRKMFTEQK